MKIYLTENYGNETVKKYNLDLSGNGNRDLAFSEVAFDKGKKATDGVLSKLRRLFKVYYYDLIQ